MNSPRVSLDQWNTLQAVIDHGGYAQAAEQLHRSQSSVSYAVNQLQHLLGIKLLEIKGRKAVLTDAGHVLLQRSRQLVSDAVAIEQQAKHLTMGWEAEVRLAAEAAYPTQCLMSALKQFEPYTKNTRIRLEEVVLSGAEDALLNGQADLIISAYIPQGFVGEDLIEVEFVAVAHPDHPLHQLGRQLTTHDLSRETHVILSDSGQKGIDSGWISESRRWTTSSPDTAHELISNGLGFGWLPAHGIQQLLQVNELKELPLEIGKRHSAKLYLVYADGTQLGPGTQKLAEILKKVTLDQ